MPTYHRHNSSFLYVQPLKDDKKVLTKPSEGVSNDRHDNANGDYIFSVGDIISASERLGGTVKPKEYVVESLLGAGSFGQVFRCVCKDTHQTFAIKVIKNLPAYTKQAALEKTILTNVFFPFLFNYSLLCVSSLSKPILMINATCSDWPSNSFSETISVS